jgi:hypothetical protein
MSVSDLDSSREVFCGESSPAPQSPHCGAVDFTQTVINESKELARTWEKKTRNEGEGREKRIKVVSMGKTGEIEFKKNVENDSRTA